MKGKGTYDLLLALAVLLAAAVLYLFFRPGGEGAWVVVERDGAEIARYPLSEDRTVPIGTDDYNLLEIQNGAAAVTEANCGDHTCVRTGTISRQGETIVCLPHHLIIRVTGGEAAPVDAATQ